MNAEVQIDKSDGAEVWDKDSIPFDVALEVVKKEMEKEVSLLKPMEDITLKAERTHNAKEPVIVQWSFWIGSDRVGWAPTLAEARALIKTPEQLKAEQITKIRAELAQLESEVSR